MWHRLLLLLHIRNEFDWAPPSLGPEVNHPYYQHEALRCCQHCGGGYKHAIHRKPYNERRAAEVEAIELERAFRWAETPEAKALANQKMMVNQAVGDLDATRQRAFVERERLAGVRLPEVQWHVGEHVMVSVAGFPVCDSASCWCQHATVEREHGHAARIMDSGTTGI